MLHNVLRTILRKFPRELLMEFLHEHLEIPSAEDFDKGDAKQIEQWLSMSARHRGFHVYTKARDRKIAQSIVSMPVSTDRERMLQAEAKGARMEIVRLYNRGNVLRKKQEEEKRKKQ